MGRDYKIRCFKHTDGQIGTALGHNLGNKQLTPVRVPPLCKEPRSIRQFFGGFALALGTILPYSIKNWRKSLSLCLSKRFRIINIKRGAKYAFHKLIPSNRAM